jgi:5-methyltetrahydropteroyltriglutamate--homocysteine methyltransferase
MVSSMEDIGSSNYQWLISVPEISIISLDLTRGDNLGFIEEFGFPADKILGGGLIDSRSVWRFNPDTVTSTLKRLATHVSQLRIQPSGSLQYVPWDLACEKELLEHPAGPVLSFALQKLEEIVDISRVEGNTSALAGYKQAWKQYKSAVESDSSVTFRVQGLTEKDFCRAEPFEIRKTKQLQGMPFLPTTTIGSFPQTKAIRNLRAQHKKGALSDEAYEAAIDKQIAVAIGIQEALGLDILVHGEAERTDMVEFFGQKIEGMLFSSNGWVQSFGSRCVRPPIIWADVSRPKAMTVREFVVAQELTDKPVKGMLTGPVTILNWSFPRIDVSRQEQAMQIALCIRDEIQDLENAGCVVVQVDEPALREAMPLRRLEKEEYLNWAVDAFRLSTAQAASETQIHTHMCYCEFQDCMGAIDRLDTDVNSIENARNDNATLLAFKNIGYSKALGPGTYDIHSPVVPTVEFIAEKLESFLECMDVSQIVVNPDCGLKTRTWPETIAALKNMVTATEMVRQRIAAANN